MSKPVKALLRRELSRRLDGVVSLVVLSLTGIDGVTANQLRRRLRDENINLMVVKNSIARWVFKEKGLEQGCSLIDGPCALAWGADSVVHVVRTLLDEAKEIPNIQIKGALFEGEIFGPDRIEHLASYPTRTEALATLAMLIRAAGAKLAGSLIGPAGRLAGAIKQIGEREEN